ncbi:MAG TPA: DUF4129 domain-containing protein [Streptosporangiaceae bacterium]|jgi:hypothetical protein
MADERPAPRGQPAPAIRVVAAGLLLAVALAGLRASVHPHGLRNGPLAADGLVIGIVLELILVGLLVVIAMRFRRGPAVGQPAAGLRAGLRVFLLMAALAMPVLLTLDHIGPSKPRPPRTPAKPRSPAFSHRTPLRGHGGGAGISGTVLLYIAIVIGLALLAVICVLVARRMTSDDGWGGEGEPADDETAEAQLRRAVASGRAAMREYDDARLAIIACYVAMEASLARAGAARGEAETPDELLSRTVADGLVPAGEAGTLTELFYEARFSSHPLPEGRRGQARRALEVIAAALARKSVPAEMNTAESSTGATP